VKWTACVVVLDVTSEVNVAVGLVGAATVIVLDIAKGIFLSW